MEKRGLPISRSTGLIITGALAAVVTALMAWPVLLAPSQLVYGHEIVGRHPDVHAAITTFAGSFSVAVSSQPLTNLTGWLFARAVGPVAAYNLVVLVTFPLAAMAAYALARYLYDSHGAALIAGLAYAFAPIHLAQAAYHPYVAQTHWLPLFVLALVTLVDRATIARAAVLALATAALVLSNVSAAVVGALVAPLVILAFWIIRPDADRNLWPLVWPAAVIVVFAAVGSAVLFSARTTTEVVQSLGHSIGDIGLYRARWWAYFTPAVDHPVLGHLASRVFDGHGVNLELLELQIYVGYAFALLAVVAVVAALWTWRPDSRYLLALAAVAAGAAVVSIGPASGSCERFSVAPACFMFRVAPLFRTYARFGLVVSLAVSIAAGAGATMLARGSRAGKALASALLAVGAFEFWPLPARSHDVLPTSAHRWLASMTVPGRILDCYPANQAEVRLADVMGRHLDHLSERVPTCGDPELGTALAAAGYSHVIVRGGQASSKLTAPPPPGVAQLQAFPDATVYAVTAQVPAVVTTATSGFFPHEHDGNDWWRWMASAGRWHVRNTTSAPRRVVLAVDLLPYGMPRVLTVRLDDTPVATLSLRMERGQHVLGPWTLGPGDHVLTFAADGDATRPADVVESPDRRPLAIAFRNVRWSDAP